MSFDLDRSRLRAAHGNPESYKQIRSMMDLFHHEMARDWDESEVVHPSGQLARVTSRTVQVGSVDCGGMTIPLTATEYGEVEGLPEPEDGTIYVVSSLVAQSFRERDDVFIPNESVRDEDGHIVGCKSLGRV